MSIFVTKNLDIVSQNIQIDFNCVLHRQKVIELKIFKRY